MFFFYLKELIDWTIFTYSSEKKNVSNCQEHQNVLTLVSSALDELKYQMHKEWEILRFTIYFYNLNLYYIFMSYKKYIFNNFDYVQSSTSSSSQWCYACLQQMCGLSSTTSFIFSSLFCLSSHYKNKKLYFYLVFVFNLFFIFLIAIYFILF